MLGDDQSNRHMRMWTWMEFETVIRLHFHTPASPYVVFLLGTQERVPIRYWLACCVDVGARK